MEKYVWLFPLIFIFHDMEEIVGYGIWLKNNKEILQKKYPQILAQYKDFSTEGFALAVFEELIICILLSAVLFFTKNPIVLYLWLGGFIGCDLHFVIHIGQSIVMKKYIPALITSIICLPISTYLIILYLQNLSGNLVIPIICIIVGIALVGINLKFAQKMIGWFTRKMNITPLI